MAFSIALSVTLLMYQRMSSGLLAVSGAAYTSPMSCLDTSTPARQSGTGILAHRWESKDVVEHREVVPVDHTRAVASVVSGNHLPLVGGRVSAIIAHERAVRCCPVALVWERVGAQLIYREAGVETILNARLLAEEHAILCAPENTHILKYSR